MITGLDHVVILADDLDEAIRRYTGLGFEVLPGGEHPDAGTVNALIPLRDGAYLELLAAAGPIRSAGHRFWRDVGGRRRQGGEYAGFALGSDDLDTDVVRIRRAGIVIDGPHAGSRRRPDGQVVQWRVALPERQDLPFLIEDETPRLLRIPAPTAGLGAAGRVAEVVVTGLDLIATAAAFGNLVGDSPVPSPASVAGATSRAYGSANGEIEFHLAPCRFVLLGPTGGADAPPAVGPERAGVSAVTLDVASWEEATVLVPSLIQVEAGSWLIDPVQTGGTLIFLRPET